MSEYEIDFDSIGQGVIQELYRRLGSAELAQDLPGTLLMKFAESYLKAIEKRNEIEAAKLESKTMNPLEMIDQPGMALPYRYTMLLEYLNELEEWWKTASARMVIIVEEMRRDTDLLPQLQELEPQGDEVYDLRVEVGTERALADGELELPPEPHGEPSVNGDEAREAVREESL